MDLNHIKHVGALSNLAGYAATCRRRNLEGWMVGLVERINRVCEASGDSDRFVYDKRSGEIRRDAAAGGSEQAT